MAIGLAIFAAFLLGLRAGIAIGYRSAAKRLAQARGAASARA
jgi:hypothetical protein